MRNYAEYAQCKTYYEWCQWNPVVRGNIIHNVNEGKRSKREGARLKAIGLVAGLPDYQIIIANKKYHSLWLEMKVISKINKKMPPHQVEWIQKLLKNGHFATFAFGADHAIELTLAYLNNKI